MPKCYDCLHFKFLRITRKNRVRLLKRFYRTLKVENLIQEQGFANVFFCAKGSGRSEVYAEHREYDHFTHALNREGIRRVLEMEREGCNNFVDNSPMTEQERAESLKSINRVLR